MIHGTGVVYAFFGLAALAILVILTYAFKIELNRERENIRNPVKADIDVTDDTVNLVDGLNSSQKENITTVLRGAAEDVASELGVPPNVVRSNLFGMDNDGRMKMLPGLTFNMNRPDELTISMPVRKGSSGRCFQTGRPNIAVFREDWGKNVIDDEELRKVHPDLKWIISVRVLLGASDSRTIWVLNVDSMDRRSEGQLQSAIRRLFYWSRLISLIVTER